MGSGEEGNFRVGKNFLLLPHLLKKGKSFSGPNCCTRGRRTKVSPLDDDKRYDQFLTASLDASIKISPHRRRDPGSDGTKLFPSFSLHPPKTMRRRRNRFSFPPSALKKVRPLPPGGGPSGRTQKRTGRRRRASHTHKEWGEASSSSSSCGVPRCFARAILHAPPPPPSLAVGDHLKRPPRPPPNGRTLLSGRAKRGGKRQTPFSCQSMLFLVVVVHPPPPPSALEPSASLPPQTEMGIAPLGSRRRRWGRRGRRRRHSQG